MGYLTQGMRWKEIYRVMIGLSISGMWSTRQMVNRGDDRELFQRSTVRELAIYCCFLVVLIAITFGTTSSVMFYYTQVMGGLFIRAKDVDSVEAFWEVCTECTLFAQILLVFS